MAKGGKKQKEAASAGQDAVLDLRMDSSTPEAPREVAAEDSGGFQTPCTITGVMAGLSGGTLGYVFGFGEWNGPQAVSPRGLDCTGPGAPLPSHPSRLLLRLPLLRY